VPSDPRSTASRRCSRDITPNSPSTYHLQCFRVAILNRTPASPRLQVAAARQLFNKSSPFHHDARDSAAAAGSRGHSRRTETSDGVVVTASSTPSTKMNAADLRDRQAQCHHLRGVAMKDTAGVGVEMKRTYSSGHRFHHPNSAPWKTCPNPICQARTKEQEPLSPAAKVASRGKGDQQPRRRRSEGEVSA
jgi:hypothetical protein